MMNHGFQKIISNLEKSTSETLQTLGKNLQEVEEAAVVSMRKSVIGTPEQKAYVVGKMAQDEVQTPEGDTLIEKGKTITPSEVEMAQQHSILMDIYRVADSSEFAQGVDKK